MSKSAGGQRQSTTTGTNGSTAIDQQSQDWLKQIMDAAKGAGAGGPSPLLTDASGYNTGMMKAGNLGMGALSGDPNAVKTLMDPYQQQVIDANNKQWGQTNANTMNTVNDAATRAGAFGGSRAAVARGAALSGNNIAQQAQTADLYSRGFNNTMDRAGQMAQMGYAGAGANANLGFGGVGSPQQWLMQMMKQGYMGPMGSTNSQRGSAATTGVATQGGFKVPGWS